MYCVRCGRKASKGDALCVGCGMRLIEPDDLISLLKTADGLKKAPAKKADIVKPQNADKGEKVDAPKVKEGFFPKLKRKEGETLSVILRDATILNEEFPHFPPKTKTKKSQKPEEGEIRRPKSKTEAKRRLSDPKGETKDVKKSKETKGEGSPRKAVQTVKLPPKEKTNVQMPEKRKKFSFETDDVWPKIEAAPKPEKHKKPKKPTAKVNKSVNNGTRPAPRINVRGVETRKKNTVIPKREKPRTARNKYASYRRKETFFEKHARSIIAMALLAATVFLILGWGSCTDSGRLTFAQMGISGAEGYILLGDNCMKQGNYFRAVDYYYKALSEEITYEAAARLADAYHETGDLDMETSALLLCLDRFPHQEDARERLNRLYPDPATRPETVKKALENG